MKRTLARKTTCEGVIAESGKLLNRELQAGQMWTTVGVSRFPHAILRHIVATHNLVGLTPSPYFSRGRRRCELLKIELIVGEIFQC